MLHRINNRKSGMTLLEIVLTIVILGVGFLGVLIVFSGIGVDSAKMQVVLSAESLAEGLLEEVVSKYFDESTFTDPASLGADAGETARSDYDDVDDFQNYVQSSIGGFPGFKRTVRVFYVESSALNDSVADTSLFKKIIVKATNTSLDISVELSSLATSQ